MDRFALFTQKLYKIEEELEALSQEFADLSLEYTGQEFVDQDKYANYLNDLLESITHGSASDISLSRKALMVSAAYIGFRKKHKYFSDSQLAELIDTNLSSEQKLAFKRLLFSLDNQEFLATLAALKKEWNTTFSNKTYQQIKSALTF